MGAGGWDVGVRWGVVLKSERWCCKIAVAQDFVPRQWYVVVRVVGCLSWLRLLLAGRCCLRVGRWEYH